MKITKLSLILMGVSLLLVSQQILAQSSQDKAAVTSAVNGITTHFFNKDMKKFTQLWSEDAVFITVGGMKADGRNAIVDMHSMAEFIVDESTQTILEQPVITFPDRDLSIAYSVWGGLVFKMGGRKLPVQSGYLTAVLRKKSGAWKIVSATNALNFDNRQPYKLETYTPELWKRWGFTRPPGLPLGK
ncbi:MAG: nuclear transport factor 2 family protein [bacterium]|nr:nuclear transport factor 2 family protein [bacterium]